MEDERWMDLALEQARKGIGRTAPNPPVGAVIVKNGLLLGAGWHRAAGQPHAEREAMAAARRDFGDEALRGSTVYVTLEPCSTHGRTPPCTAGLIEAGVARVVYAVADRNPSHAGRADALLADAGIQVESGVGAAVAEQLVRPFFKVQSKGLPWVIWKTAMSLDGRLTRPPGEGQWLSGTQSRATVQEIRSEVDAIVTSGETVRRDSPQLTIRNPGLLEGRDQPWRVVLTSKPECMPAGCSLFTDQWKHRTLIRSGGDLEGMLRGLVSEQGVLSVLLEAGGALAASFIECSLVDELVVYLAPLLCGGPTPALSGIGQEVAVDHRSLRYTRLGDDIMLRGLIL